MMSFSRKKLFQVLLIGFVVAVTSILAVASWAKLFHPSQRMPTLDLFAGVVEVVMVGCLLLFYRSFQWWLVLGLVFGFLGGYSLFWVVAHLPCGCLGNWLELPRGLTLGIDIAFLLASFTVALFLGAKGIFVRLTIALCVVLGVFGYLSAREVYQYSESKSSVRILSS